MQFSIVIYIFIFYTLLKFQNILICFELFRKIFSKEDEMYKKFLVTVFFYKNLKFKVDKIWKNHEN